MIIAIDFDNTIAYKTENLEPQELLPCAKEVINWMYDLGIHIIIWTCRTGPELRKAIDFLNGKGVKYHDVNSNAEDLDFQTSNKIYADVYIDDRMLGNEEIDWMEIKQMIEDKMKPQPKEEIIIQEIVIAKISASTKELYLQNKVKAEVIFKKFLFDVERKNFKTISLPKFPKPQRYLDSGQIYGIGMIVNSKNWDIAEVKELKAIAKRYGLKYEDLDETRTEIYFYIPRKVQWKSGPAKEGYD